MSEPADNPLPSPEPFAPTAADDGIDVSLIRWALSLTPQQRLEVLQANAEALVRLQHVAAADLAVPQMYRRALRERDARPPEA
jgi:hypothetical protein